MTWRPIYKQSSLPYERGDLFLARINKCECEIDIPNVLSCLKTRPCVAIFKTLADLSFFRIDEQGKSHNYTKNGIITQYKYWKPYADQNLSN